MPLETSSTTDVQRTSGPPTVSEACSHEHNDEEEQRMDLASAQVLLWERGYHLLCRFEHVHATAAGQEWHVCRVDELATIHPSQFLAFVEEAMRFSWQPE